MILAEAPESNGGWYAADGSLRLQVRPLLVSRLVAPRLLRPDEHDALVKQADAVRETASSGISVHMDLDDIDSPWQKTNDLLASADQMLSAVLRRAKKL